MPGVASVSVHFPDQNLEAAVREALRKPTADITAEDMGGLTSLTAQMRGILNLTGLEYATNLQNLSLNENQISDLSPLGGLTNLHALGLNENQISDLSPLGGLTSLQVLYLYQNQITDISALVANNGIGFADTVLLQDNLLDLSRGSKAMTDIQTLISRGTAVICSPQRAGLVNEEASVMVAAMVAFIVVMGGRKTQKHLIARLSMASAGRRLLSRSSIRRFVDDLST